MIANGVDPTKANDDFKITHFWMEGGKLAFRLFTLEVELP